MFIYCTMYFYVLLRNKAIQKGDRSCHIESFINWFLLIVSIVRKNTLFLSHWLHNLFYFSLNFFWLDYSLGLGLSYWVRRYGICVSRWTIEHRVVVLPLPCLLDACKSFSDD